MSTTQPVILSDFGAEFARLEQRKKQLLEKLNEAITGLPDNPKINRLSGNMFVMSSGDLSRSSNLSATHYDFKEQYRCIAFTLTHTEDVFEKFNQIITERKCRDYRYPAISQFTINLHEEVIKNILTLAPVRVRRLGYGIVWLDYKNYFHAAERLIVMEKNAEMASMDKHFNTQARWVGYVCRVDYVNT